MILLRLKHGNGERKELAQLMQKVKFFLKKSLIRLQIFNFYGLKKEFM